MQEGTTDWPVGKMLRSTDFGMTWAITDTIYNCYHPRLRAGAGTHIYMGAAPHVAMFNNVAQASLSTLYGGPGTWSVDDVFQDTFDIWDAVFAPAFTLPESTAMSWIVFTHNWQATPDWDVLYAYTDDRMANWSAIDDIAYTPSVEAYVDLKNYTSPGNTYMNASYVITDDNSNYLTWTEASRPDVWSAAEPINLTVQSAWGYELTPQIVYSPFGPGSGGGLVFADRDSSGLYFNAPWFTGAVAEQRAPARATVLRVLPSIGTGPVGVSWTGSAERVSIVDVTGRVVRDYPRPAGQSLVWDGRVPSGTYLVRLRMSNGQATAAVVIQ
jgi:hypothetical protein